MIRPTTRRILMTADTVGGVWTYAVELIRALEPHGVQVLLATMGRAVSGEQSSELHDLNNVELAESAYKLEWMDDPWRDVEAAGEWLLSLERDFAPDVIHLNGYSHGALPWNAPTIVVGHSCVASWWQAVKREGLPAAWKRYHAEVQAGLHAADLVIAPTRAMLNSLNEHYGALPSVQVIPNGRRLDFFQPKPKENFISSAGRLWDEAKNVRAVCACSFELNWPLCIAGETEFAGVGINTAPNANVRALGRLSSAEMIDQMARAAIFAHPAKYEPFGLSVLEAALSGCALVLGDLPSLRENWDGAALFVDPRNCDELRDAISGLIEVPALRDELGRAARERAQRFDIQTTALRYVEAYDSLLAANPKPARKEAVAV